ncbi:MAG: Gfo/Idh/MocA family oxidoreductase [Parabacteroides sp.]
MSINRRNFLKGSLLGAGVALTGFTGCTSTNKSEVEAVVKECVEKGKNRKQLFNMCGYAAAPIPVVRIGYVGIGSRGSWAVTRILNIKEIEIRGLCDLREEAVKRNQETLKNFNKRPAEEYFGDEYAWKKLCEQEDIDLIYIATPWKWHTPIAVYAMECGKHVAVEVPAAKTLEECWQLVETSERTKKTLHAVGKLLL